MTSGGNCGVSLVAGKGGTTECSDSGSSFSETAPGGSTMAGRCANKAYSIVHEGAGSPLRLMSMYTVKTGSSEKTPKSLSPPPLGPAATTVRPYEPVASGPKGRPAPGVAALLAPPTIDIPANGRAPRLGEPGPPDWRSRERRSRPGCFVYPFRLNSLLRADFEARPGPRDWVSP